MTIVGISLSAFLTSNIPAVHPDMSDEDAQAVILEQQENQDFSTLAAIVAGVGFLLILISFGARKKRKGGSVKTVEKKPAK